MKKPTVEELVAGFDEEVPGLRPSSAFRFKGASSAPGAP